MTKAEIKYTTDDGKEHVEIVDLCVHPIVALSRVIIEGREIPMDRVRVFEQA